MRNSAAALAALAALLLGGRVLAAAPGEAGAGQLYGRTDGDWTALPVLSVDYRVDVTGPMVHGTLLQSFDNPANETIEVQYVFPLPEDAAVHRMEMRIGERRIVSRVQEKERARRTYREARDAGKKTALLEQNRPNLFRTRVANINAGERIEVHLEFVQELRCERGEFDLALPLTYTPRYDPRTRTCDAEPDQRVSYPQATVEVRIHSGIPLEEPVSHSHELDTRWDGDVLVVTPADGPVVADRDFLLLWRPLLAEQPLTAAHVEDRPDGRYVLLMLMPPAARFEPAAGLPTETVFVIDVSGSMQGPSIVQARTALEAALERLRPGDAFDIVAFNTGLETYADELIEARPDTLETARRWVRSLHADGGTHPGPALEHAASLLRDGDPTRVRRIVFLTDGAVSNEDELFAAAIAGLGDTRLHMLGIGAAPNRYLVTRIATLGGGLCEFVADVMLAKDRIDGFFRRLDRPVMTDLALDWEGVQPLEVYPRRLPDLHAGQPLIVSARLAPGDEATVARVRGRLAGGEVSIRAPVRGNAPVESGVAIRWARAKVRSLIGGLYEGAEEEAVRAEVLDVALAHGLVTRYTSLVAVEEFASALDDPRRFDVRGAAPAGASVSLPIGGTLNPLLSRLGVVSTLLGAALLLLVRRAA